MGEWWLKRRRLNMAPTLPYLERGELEAPEDCGRHTQANLAAFLDVATEVGRGGY